MDEKKSNIRLVRGARKVTKNTTEYDWNDLERRTAAEKSKNIKPKSPPTEFEKKIRHQKNQRRQRLKIKRRRTLIALILAAILLCVLLFMTPIFNIRSVSVEGNSLVTAEQFQEKLKPLVGENLFRTGSRRIRKTLKEIPFIKDAHVQKRMFPPSVKVQVVEYVPTALLRAEGTNLLVNSELRVLTAEGDPPMPVPVITGFGVTKGEAGAVVQTEEAEKKDVIITILQTLEQTGMIDKITEISINDVTNITMNYDNRITVFCGTQLDIDRKLRLLKESITSGSLSENAKGTMDLSESGKAVYTP